jgi:adenosyl cobinamide kinase/adenosyl cobinamide phosphate guanylyltransferase
MALVVLLGGARSGKSAFAVTLARAAGVATAVIATGEPGDDEMTARIERHRTERPAGWSTIEEPRELAFALASPDPGDTVVVDCLTLWVANLLGRGDERSEILAAAEEAASLAASRRGLTVAVSNEVGLGIVPHTPLGRVYRDLLGEVNTIWVGAAAKAVFLVAGRALPLLDAGDVLDRARAAHG